MDKLGKPSLTQIHDFFERCGLKPSMSLECDSHLAALFPGQHIRAASTQGYCSYTVLVGDTLVAQFRPSKYDLDMKIVVAANAVYGELAQATNFISVHQPSKLLVYTMDMVPGMSLQEFKISRLDLSSEVITACQMNLCTDFAKFLARSWHGQGQVDLPLGMIGSSLKTRLERLSNELPQRFRQSAFNVLTELETILALPWVLTHGDIVSGNIMIDPTNARINGMVDWAEAEMLPFGTCLYGLEEILGQVSPHEFRLPYNISELRELFWNTLRAQIPELQDESTIRAVLLVRTMGILLWHGFSWDDGAIDRVVDDERDQVEVLYLTTLLGTTGR